MEKNLPPIQTSSNNILKVSTSDFKAEFPIYFELRNPENHQVIESFAITDSDGKKLLKFLLERQKIEAEDSTGYEWPTTTEELCLEDAWTL